MTPNQMSLVSLFIGVVAGVFFYHQEDIAIIGWACFFITLSGILDSADGQLARMTGQSSEIGRVIDGAIDSLVFMAAYIGGGIYFYQQGYGLWIIPLGVAAGYTHSVKSCVYEYYKAEFVYYVKADRNSRIAYVSEMQRPIGKGLIYTILYYLEVDYARKQSQFHGRKRENRERFEKYALNEQPKRFSKLYSEINEPIMTWWALVCGTNTHRTALMVCSLFGRMDIYFFFSIVTILPMFLIVKKQRKLDNQLLNLMAEE